MANLFRPISFASSAMGMSGAHVMTGLDITSLTLEALGTISSEATLMKSLSVIIPTISSF